MNSDTVLVSPKGPPDIRTLEQFLFQEACLLDERCWREWVDLFTDDGDYWVPVDPAQSDPFNHVSIFYEDKTSLELRVRRFKHPNLFSQQPPSRSVHLVSNVLLEHFDEIRQECRVKSAFVVMEHRRQTQYVYGGWYTHCLQMINDKLRIRQKRVDIINSDAALDSIHIFL